MKTDKSGRDLARDGMATAEEHANLVHEDWSFQAATKLTEFLSERDVGDKFMAEDFRTWATEQGLPRPPSNRAFGSVIAKAARAGMIAKAGYRAVKNPLAHCTPATLWEVKKSFKRYPKV